MESPWKVKEKIGNRNTLTVNDGNNRPILAVNTAACVSAIVRAGASGERRTGVRVFNSGENISDKTLVEAR